MVNTPEVVDGLVHGDVKFTRKLVSKQFQGVCSNGHA